MASPRPSEWPRYSRGVIARSTPPPRRPTVCTSWPCVTRSSSDCPPPAPRPLQEIRCNPLSSAASRNSRSLKTRGLPANMSWFEKIMPSRIKTERRTRSVPEGLWIKCSACDAVLYRAELERNLNVCPKCSHHMRMGARERLERFLDPETIEEIGANISPEDPLRFRDSKRY